MYFFSEELYNNTITYLNFRVGKVGLSGGVLCLLVFGALLNGCVNLRCVRGEGE